MVRKRKCRAVEGLRRSAAVLGAALLLLAQLLAAAHTHQSLLKQDLKAQTELGADSGMCAVCLLAFHLPLNPAAAAVVASPQTEIQGAFRPARYRRRSFDLSSSPTRAPPRSA